MGWLPFVRTQPPAPRSQPQRRYRVASVAWLWLIAAAATGCPVAHATVARAADAPLLVVGAKKFTESAILAELMAQVLEVHAGARVERRLNLAGTQVCFDALRAGDIDLYPEYTGTGLRNILHDARSGANPSAVFALVSDAFRERFGLLWLSPFGFNNTYVLIMRRDRAAARDIESLSDLARHPLRFGMSYEFLERADGMTGLRHTYGLNEARTVGIEYDLAYQALADGTIDVSDGYSTDAKIVSQDLVALNDDRQFFPPYEAAPLVRQDVLSRVPQAAAALALLAGRIDEGTMRRLNFRIEVERHSLSRVASDFLVEHGLSTVEVNDTPRSASLLDVLWQRRWITLWLTGQHLLLTGSAVAAAAILGLPLGIGASRRSRLASTALGIAGVLQTVPAIALIVFMLPLFGIGTTPAVMALFLYGLLPILRNTVTGLRNVDQQLLEVGRGLGMKQSQLLRWIELPLAAPVILAGIRTATVISVGTATLAAFIGAGGLGDPIVTGLSVTDVNLVLSGALPAAALALVLDGLLSGVERLATPRGLRLQLEAPTR